jgi:hypothetical protein
LAKIPTVSGDKDTNGIWGERIDEFFDSKNTIKKFAHSFHSDTVGILVHRYRWHLYPQIPLVSLSQIPSVSFSQIPIE